MQSFGVKILEKTKLGLSFIILGLIHVIPILFRQ